ncbi:hypothetical protein [Corynebacterium striatum]|uniref:hypothetical protein n=1 Tax=Corynebacterium striatum TaxID=43770 RepID=UPI0032203A1A
MNDKTFASTPSVPKTSTLVPKQRDWAKDLLSIPSDGVSELTRLATLAAGPFHVLNTQVFRQNLNAFAAVCERHGVDSHIYFAHKANKSACWIPAVAEEGHRVDVASGEELTGALGAGVCAADLVVTGAEKSQSLLTLALRQRVLIAVDSPSELFRINSLAKDLGVVDAPVLIRLLPEEQPETRFGTSMAQWLRELEALREQSSNGIDCRGVTFQLNGYSPAQRNRQAHKALDFMEILRIKGWTAEMLDIGGGFSVQYCEPSQWEMFREKVIDSPDKRDYFHSGRIPEGLYPYGGQGNDGPEMLDEILSGVANSPSVERIDKTSTSLAERLKNGRFQLAIEPGRAASDGCGLSVFPIQGVKWRDDYIIITVAGLSMSLSEQWKGSEYMPDMTLWENPGSDDGANYMGRPSGGSNCLSRSVGVCVGGSSCMEYDMLTWRKVQMNRIPRVGDLVIYHNTAGYQMDKNESEFHQIRLPMRFVWEGRGSLPKIDRPLYRELV